MPTAEKFGDRDAANPNEALILAAKEGRIEDVERLVTEEGADIDYWQDAGGSGYTALQWAVQQTQVPTIKMLLRLGADPNVQHKSGNIALQWACHDGKVEIATMLLKAGSDIQMTNFGGYNSRDSAHHRAFDDPKAEPYMINGAKKIMLMIDKVLERQRRDKLSGSGSAGGSSGSGSESGGSSEKKQRKRKGSHTNPVSTDAPPPPPAPPPAPPRRMRKRRGEQ